MPRVMTRILRSSCYADMYEPPLTTVARDCDLVDTLESAREGLYIPGALMVFDIFELPGKADVETATMTAIRRQVKREFIERNMAIAYHYNAVMLERTNGGGALGNPDPAPFGVEECRDVLMQLAQHPSYDHQHVIMQSNDHRMVVMHDGKIEVDP